MDDLRRMIQSLPLDVEGKYEYENKEAKLLSRLLVPLLSKIVDRLEAIAHRTKKAPGADGKDTGD